MDCKELRNIINQWGGVDKFAAIIGVRPRVVYYWLAGNRRMSEPVARLIRLLKSNPSQTEEQ